MAAAAIVLELLLAFNDVGGTSAVFAGQTDDPFFLDLRVFDLLYGANLSEAGVDSLTVTPSASRRRTKPSRSSRAAATSGSGKGSPPCSMKNCHWLCGMVALSATLRQALQALERRADGYVLPYRTAGSAWRHMQALCRAAEVTPKGVHALRHSAGTRLYAETRGLEATARHLGHSKLETTRIYAKWSARQLRETIGRW